MRLVGYLVLLFLLSALGVFPEAWAQEEPGARVITLEEAFDIALRQHTDLLRAENQTRLAELDLGERRMNLFPQLSLSTSGSQSYGRSFSLEEGQFINERTEFVSLRASTSLTLFDGFSRWAHIRGAEHGQAASERRLERTRQEVLFEVLEHFLDHAADRSFIELREEELRLRQEQLDEALQGIRAGTRSSVERYRMEASVAEAEHQLLSAERAAELSRTELVEVLALEPGGAYVFEAPALEGDPAVPGPEMAEDALDALIDEALQQRLDLAAYRLDLEAARQEVRAAGGDRWPQLSLSAGYGSNWSSAARQPLPDDPSETHRPPFFEQLDSRRSGSVSLSLNFPLFDRGQARRSVERAEVRLQQARYDLEDARREVALELRRAYYDWEGARKEVEVAAKRLEAAEKTREAAEENYRLGLAPLMELTEANAEYVSAARARLEARYDLALQHWRLDYLRGRTSTATLSR